MIDIQDLGVQFGGVKPIDGLTVQLTKQIVGLIGPNGAGKTTLLNVLSGFVVPVRGRVSVDGHDLTGVAPHRRAALGLRRTFQTDQIADDLTLKENVLAVADHIAFEGGRAAAEKATLTAIDFVGLSRRLNRRGSDLSTEERHLGEIAKAIIGAPRLVMLDEPGAGMSEAESTHLERVIKDIPFFCGGPMGKTQVFLVDHDVALISACCHETMVLDFGRLLALGNTHDVLLQPEVQRAYLGGFEEVTA
ncbi:MAG TPA: ATP-binding cassette domain-containing protein [Burkholderiaceae bacterium]|nr:ATP-binding cassette domain-containing protein [Burkholderiaceae bacterium]